MLHGIDARHGGLDKAGAAVAALDGQLLRGEVPGREALHGKRVGKHRAGDLPAEGAGVPCDRCKHGVLSVVLHVAHGEGYGSAAVAVFFPATVGEVVVGTRGKHAQ